MIDASGLTARPPSEVEWEDLLVRLEIGPRALRLAVEDLAAEPPELQRLLSHAAATELWWSTALDELRAGRELPVEESWDVSAPAGGPLSVAALLEIFERLRGRNFARVQRRGLDVWGWRSRCRGAGELTGYQALQVMQRDDAARLAAVRLLAGE